MLCTTDLHCAPLACIQSPGPPAEIPFSGRGPGDCIVHHGAQEGPTAMRSGAHGVTSRRHVTSGRHLTSQNGVIREKELKNVRRGRCVNAQAFSFWK